MSHRFEIAHSFTARWEGGLTDHPSDPGGLTNYGVSLRWVRELAEQAREECLRQRRDCDTCSARVTPRCRFHQLDMDHDGDVDADDIRACTREQAAALFKKHFWDRPGCDALPLPLAVALYDGAVNMGEARAVRQLQQAMNMTGEAQLDAYVPIAEDGIAGPRTRELAEALEAANLHWFAARQALRLRDAFYRDLAARRPSMKVFLNGWRNRVRALAQYLADLEREEN
ncbi:glycosyl hydrolase 108 family protein [uncultured Desulfovibrio sp.]|uniref:glycoside hydrolase family 108 protein n=1 Tax=uncultured Desulfovibrio sp. TaxID=167968 RepID=UPI002635903D|nr:glycosyl hydrolase 108 family protein [uncultured Desulfovibrio sp.]